MKTKTRLAKSCGLIGAGVGAALYAVFGLMQAMALGGTAGLLLTQEIYGRNTLDIVGSGLITRVILAASMLTGAFVALIMFLVLGSAIGYALGFVLGLTIKEEVAGEPGRRESY